MSKGREANQKQSGESFGNMIASGLLITLRANGAERRQLVQTLRSHPAFLVGEICEHWMSAAMEAVDDEECRKLHDWLMAQPGVAYVDVVSVYFTEQQEAA